MRKDSSVFQSSMPAEFDICLSNVCNMACRYCYWDNKAKIKPAKLSFEQISRGLALYLKNRNTGIEKIAIGGGEPLFDFPLLAKVIKHIRREVGSKVEIELFTNGTLMDKDKVGFLLKHKVKIILSLDGNRKNTNLNRCFKETPLRSVFDVVVNNLNKLDSGMIGEICAGVTFNSKTVKYLPGNIKFLSGLGFKEVLVDMDILEIWKSSELKQLEKILPKVKAVCVEEAKKSLSSYGRSPIGLDFIFSEEEKNAILNLTSFRELSLGPDGGFYPSGLVSAQGPKRNLYKLGDLKSGIDLKKIKVVLKEVKNYFSNARFKGYAACPVNLYFYNRIAGVDPGKLFSSMEKVYFSALTIHQLVESDRIATLLESNAGFGDFFHKPKYKSREPVSHLRLKMSAGGKLLKLKQVREVIDYALYSPCDKIELILSGSFGTKASDNAKCACIYALLKANYLNKKIRLVVETKKNETPNTGEMDFMAEHGIFFRLLRPLPEKGKLIKLLQKLQPEKVQMEVSLDELTWEARINKTLKVGIFNFLITAKKPVHKKVWLKFEKTFFSCLEKREDVFLLNFFQFLRNFDAPIKDNKHRLFRRLEANVHGSLKVLRKPSQENLDKKNKELFGKLIGFNAGRNYIKECYKKMNQYSFYYYPENGKK
ncbi:MAG: radical SAM protein [Elusimicrobiota bacterium]|nr:radical SAM protein [Elusimicrobiota bacterium]